MAFSELPQEMGFEPGEHDIRVERAPWVFWVRGVKRYESFTRSVSDGDPTDLSGVVLMVLFGLLYVIFVRFWDPRARWKVGVLRVKGSRWGPVGRIKVVHKEVLPAGVEPGVRIGELVERVRSGDFDTHDEQRPEGKHA
ncbi:hypothetical protein GCM10009539_62620 [Cryptosporangium japonicum]|uniref:Uncharacterized protein n=2 Tax=Cryptosporangium japonicum TaxID=80872 RepID=A0ABP3ENT4_9ACTN